MVNNKRVALVTGITGQDGTYLAEFLLEKGYEVYGMERRVSSPREHYAFHDHPNFKFIYGDLADQASLYNAIEKIKPDEVYNLAAQSHVGVSFDLAEYTGDITGLGVIRILDAIKMFCPTARFYQASSSELYGLVKETPQTEETPFHPRSPYAVAKQYGFWITKNYRESYGLFACNGILFNHESPRRGEQFVTRKITKGIADILSGKIKKIKLGNLNAKRDWGHAKDYVEAMWLMLQQDKPDDFVIATGVTRSVRDFLECAFSLVGLDWKDYVEVNEDLLRKCEVPLLLGNPSKAKRVLEWTPKHSFVELVTEMVKHDIGESK